MTLWIKNTYLECIRASILDNTLCHRILIQNLHKLIGNSFYIFDMVLCEHTRYYIERSPKNKFYYTYKNYLDGNPSYSLIRDIRCTYCDFTKEYYSGDIVQVCLLIQNQYVDFKACVGYAQEKLKNEWWYSKASGQYSNFEFDYPPFNNKYKGSPRFWRDPDNRECYGHELELKFASFEHKLLFADAIKLNYKPCITEKDGSLDQGLVDGPSLELITPPLSYEDSISKIGSILQIAKYYSVQEANNGYAWHVTVNLLNSENYQLSGMRMLSLFNDKNLRIFWQQIARRPSEANPITGRNYCKFEDKPTMSHKVWRPRWEAHPIDHYYATFLRKCGHALEIRLLKSTNDINVFTSTLELIRGAWMWAKGSDKLNIDKIIEKLSQGTQKYISERRLVNIPPPSQIPEQYVNINNLKPRFYGYGLSVDSDIKISNQTSVPSNVNPPNEIFVINTKKEKIKKKSYYNTQDKIRGVRPPQDTRKLTQEDMVVGCDDAF